MKKIIINLFYFVGGFIILIVIPSVLFVSIQDKIPSWINKIWDIISLIVSIPFLIIFGITYLILIIFFIIWVVSSIVELFKN